MAGDLRGRPEAAAEPFLSPKLLAGIGAASIAFGIVLAMDDSNAWMAETVSGLGAAILVRAFWLSWGFDPDLDLD